MTAKSAVLLIAAALAVPMSVSANTLNYNLLEFSESAAVRVPNDTMHLTLSVSAYAANREKAADEVTRRFNAVLAKAKANRAFEVETGGRNSYPEYDDKRKIKGWRDTATLNVKSRNFAALSRLAADSQNDAAIDGLYFSVSPKKYAAAVEEAGKTALQSFRNRADGLSRSLGFSGYKLVKLELVQSFEQNAESAVPMAAGVASFKSRQADVMNNEPGIQEIRQTVRGTVQMQ